MWSPAGRTGEALRDGATGRIERITTGRLPKPPLVRYDGCAAGMAPAVSSGSLSAIVPVVTLAYGAADPLVIEPGPGADVRQCRGPGGVSGAAATRTVTAALVADAHGPPLASHVVAGDRVVLAVAGTLPQSAAVVTALQQVLADAGVRHDDMTVLRSAWRPDSLSASTAGTAAATSPDPRDLTFDPTVGGSISYLAADADGRPVYLARPLVDADVVVAVGPWGWNAACGGRAHEGELWPTFSTDVARRAFAASIARRGRHALPPWRHMVRDVSWQLGICASLRLVPGAGGTLHAALFGLPAEADHAARVAASGWRPRLEAAAAVTIALVRDADAGFDAVTRAVAAAARTTVPGGTICIVSRSLRGPGIVFLRWRQGAPLVPLVREAVASGDPALVADALVTRLFARALGDRRLVLLGALGEAEVEELGFGHAATPEVVERLAHRAEGVVVLHEADGMFPRRIGPLAGPADPAGSQS